ncbi:glycosyltransferase family 2 protein [Paenibacillus hamazuiensis]|uniref:glycosyltransferase family 2 protein n=1 Tax=Paenibacillus hamazuiensis TaxID=2936508 RepID=UPI00200D6EBF|nr:glycosyltransferase family 2 protein [Paenibacillus hamazuiensis]
MTAHDYPLVSIITPSFNQGKYIRETIESVLAQEYPNIEHIIIDGGSSDETLGILHSYSYLGERFRFVSEPDRGQAHAINKGLAMAKGSIIGWLNSDDTYMPWSVGKAVQAFHDHPEWGMVYGRGNYTDEHDRIIVAHPVEAFSKRRLFEACIICQPAAFIRKSTFLDVGGVDESYYFCMDYDLWMRIAKKYTIGDIQECLAHAKWHSEGKTMTSFGTTGLHEVFRASLKNYSAISNELIHFFVTFHQDKEPLWILHQMKPYPLFGNAPKITAMNRYDDLWVSTHFNISIEVARETPLHTLIVKGRHVIQNDPFPCSIYVNNQFYKNDVIQPGTFKLNIEIPWGSQNLDVQIDCYYHVIPAQIGLSSDPRALSYIVDEVSPLSAKEYEFYQVLQNGTAHVQEWLSKNRYPTPDL